MVATLLVGACACGPLSVSSPGLVAKDTDRFGGRTTIVLTELRLYEGDSHSVELNAYRNANGTDVDLLFTSYSTTWKYRRVRNVRALVDGTTLDLGEAAHDGSARSYSVTEFLTVRITPESLHSLANAKTVVFQIGGSTEFALQPNHLVALQHFEKGTVVTKKTPPKPRF